MAKFSPHLESITVTASSGTSLCWVNGHHKVCTAFFAMSFSFRILSEKADIIISFRELNASSESPNHSTKSFDISCGTGGSTITGTLEKYKRKWVQKSI